MLLTTIKDLPNYIRNSLPGNLSHKEAEIYLRAYNNSFNAYKIKTRRDIEHMAHLVALNILKKKFGQNYNTASN